MVKQIPVPDLREDRRLFLYIGDYPGSPDGLTYYSFTDSRAIARLEDHSCHDGYYILGFVHEINYKCGILALPFASHVPVFVEEQVFDGKYVVCKVSIKVHPRDEISVKPFNGQELEFKLKWN